MTKLLDQSCKDIRKTQSDNWSSEEEDDDVFDTTNREITSPQAGVYSSALVLVYQSEDFMYAVPCMQPMSSFFPLLFPQVHP